MASFGMLFNRKGYLLDEIDGIFSRSWKRSGVGTCSFTFPASHHKCTEQNFEIGNYLVVYHDSGWPDWVGRLDTPRGWGRPWLTVNALSAESLFAERTGPPYMFMQRLKGTGGVCFTDLVNIANLEEDTLMRPGEIYGGDRETATLVLPNFTLERNLNQLLKRTGHEYSVTPQVVNSRLTLLANWYKTIERDLDISLNESNCEMRADTLKEEGPIKNCIFAYCEEKLLFYQARDLESIHKYGLRQGALSVSAEDIETVKWNADEELKRKAWPRRTFQAIPRQLPSLTPYLRVGYRPLYENAIVGFGKTGRGTNVRVTIDGLAAKDDEGSGLVLREVIQ